MPYSGAQCRRKRLVGPGVTGRLNNKYAKLGGHLMVHLLLDAFMQHLIPHTGVESPPHLSKPGLLQLLRHAPSAFAELADWVVFATHE